MDSTQVIAFGFPPDGPAFAGRLSADYLSVEARELMPPAGLEDQVYRFSVYDLSRRAKAGQVRMLSGPVDA